MLVVKVELWPFGNETEKREIAIMRLWNDGMNVEDKLTWNYKGDSTYLAYPSRTECHLEGRVNGYNRNNPNVWNLIKRMIDDMLHNGIILGKE